MKQIKNIDMHRWYAIVNYEDGSHSVIANTDDGLVEFDSYEEWEKSL